MQKYSLIFIALAVFCGTILLMLFHILPASLRGSTLVYLGFIFDLLGMAIFFVGLRLQLKPSLLIVQNVTLISGTILIILASVFSVVIEQMMRF